jgi:hypothetical protein
LDKSSSLVETLAMAKFKTTYRLSPTWPPEVGLLNKSSCLAADLGVTKFVAIIKLNIVTLCCAT